MIVIIVRRCCFYLFQWITDKYTKDKQFDFYDKNKT